MHFFKLFWFLLSLFYKYKGCFNKNNCNFVNVSKTGMHAGNIYYI